MAYLVTGGAGFIGSHVTEALLKRGEHVIIIDDMNNSGYDSWMKFWNMDLISSNVEDDPRRLVFYQGNLADATFVARVFSEHPEIEFVCHLAARAGVRPSIDEPTDYVISNVLLEQCRLHGNIRNFVYASSSSVYGNDLEMPLSERDMTDMPISPYAATKKSCEVFAYTYSHLYGIPCSGLRYFTVYGPRGRPDMAVFKFMDRIYNGQTIYRFGDGTTKRDYTYVDDIVSGTLGALDNPRDYIVYNLGNGTPAPLHEMISIIEKHMGKQALINQLPLQQGDVDMTCADISIAKKLIGYSPQTTLDDGLNHAVTWYLNEYRLALNSRPRL